MKVVLDTSVLFQALYSSTGASHAILKLIREGALQLPISIPVFEEYREVLLRQSSLDLFELSTNDVQKIIDFIALIGVKTDIRFLLRPNLRDENDNIFIELAFASGAHYVITKNVNDFKYDADLRFNEITIATPAEFMKIWRNTYEKD
ncbi:Toxin-antitoxin system toxin component, PIN family [uncultured spirochete]|jgi:putative PIN family toxin of toxin-antitoxin system|uniref:Toxin-antitoxin system toxin component, PIN family n=1 Tax=uncultured spirochete TaxID=156406 RepID=A0A3P3XEV7_9SPIR|nr:putative toxin-antitoxin system toxin component, PIN family [Rectinema subterraneum]SLM09716.1 Toxin-antitoxin system toxin component, PIN family [uncultured spirochete]SLM15406.1 Toxin-antitoxin system toxin component, PIN family [uncultured spirochete]